MAKNYRGSRKMIQGLSVEVKNGNFEKAMRQWKRKVTEDGRLQEYRDRCEYVCPSERRRIARKASKHRAHRKQQQDNLITTKLF